MIVKLLTGHHLEFLSLKGGCGESSESTLVKCHIVGNHMPRHDWVNVLSGLGLLYAHCSIGLVSNSIFSHVGTFFWVEPVLKGGDKTVLFNGTTECHR